MILNTTFSPVSGTHLGTGVIYTDINFTISAVLQCTMENIVNGEGYDCDPEAVALGLACAGECTEETQSCDACVYINSMSIIIDIDPNTIIKTENTSDVNISGNFTLDQFDNTSVTFVSKGSSDKIETPTILPPGDVPINKDVFKVTADQRNSRTANITITATDNIGNEYVANYTYTLTNDHSYIKTWILDYIGAE